jgi:hypothetical protein
MDQLSLFQGCLQIPLGVGRIGLFYFVFPGNCDGFDNKLQTTSAAFAVRTGP